MISRVTSYKSDPNPNIPTGLSNLVPEIETREMESVMRIGNGDIAVLGGLMQDSINYKDDGIPGLSRLPGVGSLFTYKNEVNAKTELVIFLRPIVVRDASLEGDYRNYEASLPTSRYLERTWQRTPIDAGSVQ
jgi:general secretion pathway protein D